MFGLFNKDKHYYQVLLDDNFPEFYSVFTFYYPKVISKISSIDQNTDRAIETFKEAIVLLYEKLKANKISIESPLTETLSSLFKALWNQKYGFVFNVDKKIESFVKDDYLLLLKEDETYTKAHRTLIELSDFSRKLLISYYWKRQNADLIAKKYNLSSSHTVLEKLRQCKMIFLEKIS
jgi:hypothetical protein